MSRPLRYILSERLEKIGKEFNLNNYSSVGKAISRTKRTSRSNKFKKRYGQIVDSLQRKVNQRFDPSSLMKNSFFYNIHFVELCR